MCIRDRDYISGLFIQIIIVSILSSILLSILGVKYAILLGVLTGLLNVIPYIGILFSGFMAGLISFATGGNHTILVILGYLAIHLIDSNITVSYTHLDVYKRQFTFRKELHRKMDLLQELQCLLRSFQVLKTKK